MLNEDLELSMFLKESTHLSEKKKSLKICKTFFFKLSRKCFKQLMFNGGSVPKNPHTNAGDVGDTGSSLGKEDLLEKEMATHSSILAWRIMWTVGYSPWGSQRVRHDWAHTALNYPVCLILLPWWLRQWSVCLQCGLIPGWGRSPGEGNGNPLQYSCLENSMDGGAS